MGIDPAWLKAELAKPGRSQSALARFMGLAAEQVNRMCAGSRRIQADEADKIRAYLAATSPGGATIPHISPKPQAAVGLPIKGTVEAGSWREVAFTDLEHEPETLPAPKSVVDSGAFALRVSGPSMDQRYPDGSYVIVQPWHGGPLPIGKRVVVERARPDGLVETTVKELVVNGRGDLELWPRSTHPAHQTPIPHKDLDGVTVRIVGTVMYSFQPD
ncbi:LexA family transcriptional regulator [Phenylobacterium sp. J367]|uniref:LexA family protein n=1 Tax=Phenylobacterium sp. J367 TaxID=2898435 RepID=UPI00215150B7|nr:S24 family peptidase [Phenylobacterium sp. J367]MCR5876958.1 hypothetical protein [Phenylobacterium sp. J367]MCR5877026.1 hypothetical protein [Phenylobacterium sp. J367]